MPNLVMGAMGSLIPKLYELLKDEYKLQKGVKERIRSLTEELEAAQAALGKVAQVPWDQLDEQVQIWARKVREASYDMEDLLDTFLVHVECPDSAKNKERLLKSLGEKMTNFWPKITARRKISRDVKDIVSHLQEVTERCRRFKVDDIVARPATTSTIDPRLHAMFTQVKMIVGIDKSSDELKSKLQLDDMSNMKMKTVSIVGIGGLGKTTLAKAVYDNLRGDFNCRAFVSVGRNPDMKKVLQMILVALDKERYQMFSFTVFQEIAEFIDELQELLQQKNRYFIVIDDLWEKQPWEILQLAIPYDKSCEGRIIITTRNWEVARNADEVYELPPLPHDSSKKLFYTRINDDERKYVDYQPEDVSDEILRKCAGIPLAIITMASLLADKPRDRWIELYKSIDFGCRDNEKAENTTKILSFSYFDLPPHLRTCLLYLSAFPEDSVIPKLPLVWMWVAEGFIEKQKEKGLFETGEGYFNDLVNRSLIQEVEPDYYGNGIHGCRVHDMVLDFIRSMSHEENFFTVSDNNDQGAHVGSNVVRRLAHHDKIMGHSNQINCSKVRSFIALEWVIDTWAPLSSFKLIRVLNIGYYNNFIGEEPVRVESLGHLLHLRFLGINGRWVKKIPEEIGSLKMLQTLDLMKSLVMQLPSSSSLPTQLVSLRIAFAYNARDSGMFSVGRLTSLEELSIKFDQYSNAPRRLLKELGNLTELRVLDITIKLEGDDEEMARDLSKSVRQLPKLKHLEVYIMSVNKRYFQQDFVFPRDLRYLKVNIAALLNLPSFIKPRFHRQLSHVDLRLSNMDEEELKTLGTLPELHFLGLTLRCASPSISNINDSDSCYFPKLRCLKLKCSLVLFVANEEDDGKKRVSFHIWNGTDNKLQSGNEKSDNELQLLSAYDDDVYPSKPPVSNAEKKQCYISTTEGEGEGAATPQFMPRLQVLRFCVPITALRYHSLWCNNIGLEFLSSLREISVSINRSYYDSNTSVKVEEVKAALRSAAQVHPHNPTLCFE